MTRTPGLERLRCPLATAHGLIRWRMAVLLTAVCVVCFLAGCTSKKKVEQAPAATPMPTFTGPAYLHGTIGSLSRVNGDWPILASRYGVVLLPKATGSVGVPQALEQWLKQYMLRIGFKSARQGTSDLSPDRVLSDPHTAIVKIESIVPAGATAGQRVDVLVTSLPQTETTSLKDGSLLFPMELGIRGAELPPPFTTSLVKVEGELYSNPFAYQLTSSDMLPSSLIISGGEVIEDRKLELILNRPSASVAKEIADRINERFPQGPLDAWPTANARSDTQIELTIPRRFSGRAGDLVLLINHLYIQRGSRFELEQAQRLAAVLTADPEQAERVALAWQGLNKRALPVISRYYEHEDMTVRLAALRAGSRLRDERTARYLLPLVNHASAEVRLEVAQLLAYQQYSTDSHLALLRLVDDEDLQVRIKAYESLVVIGHPSVMDYRSLVVKRDEKVKFILDLVPADKPLIFINEQDLPRIVLFGPMMGIGNEQSPVVRLWDNRLMLRLPDSEGDGPMSVFYQQENDFTGKISKKTVEIMPALANLLLLLGRPNDLDYEGFDLPFGQVVEAVCLLQKDGYIDSPLEVRQSKLASVIEQMRETQVEEDRPETASRPEN